MRFISIHVLLLISALNVRAQYPDSPGPATKTSFTWPEGKKMALSLTFDDARPSQVDNGIPILDSYGVKATFYVTPGRIDERLSGWKSAVENGHEIGNHTLNHPCSGNFPWARHKSLEGMRLRDIAREIEGADEAIESLLGVTPETFAYPCGQTFVGRGAGLQSYIPLIHTLYLAGRCWMSEGPNDPVFCDPANLFAVELDGKDFDEVLQIISGASESGSWLILAGHEIGNPGSQTTWESTLEQICKYAGDPENGIWIAPVNTIVKYISENVHRPHRK